jgi:hypothetical protein
MACIDREGRAVIFLAPLRDGAAQLREAMIETGSFDKLPRFNLKFGYSVERQLIGLQRPPTRH